MIESLTSRSVRLTFDFDTYAQSVSGKAKRFRDISACVRYYVDLGRNAEKIIEINKDPQKLKEFEDKLSHMINKENAVKVLETMNETELDAFIFQASMLKKQQIQQFLKITQS